MTRPLVGQSANDAHRQPVEDPEAKRVLDAYGRIESCWAGGAIAHLSPVNDRILSPLRRVLDYNRLMSSFLKTDGKSEMLKAHVVGVVLGCE